ncbi:MAG TPA: flavin reductase family protein [Alphaproteobacteria bacterium]|nr:flavin reductase family protein [Alphaproteobacteria bacterium]
MIIDFTSLAPRIRYKLLTATVTPRPIALVSTRSRDGVDNAAPFSFFNVMGEDPPILVLGLEARAGGVLKDTTSNIRASGEFVVNLVDEDMAEAMVRCAADLPSDQSELSFAGLESEPAEIVAANRISCAPVSFECRRHVTLELSNMRNLVVGEILMMHIRDELIDTETMRVDWSLYRPIGRLFGRNYVRTTDWFSLNIPKVGDGPA